MSLEEVRAELENEILEQRYREEKEKEQKRNADIIRKETQKCTADFEDNSRKYLKMNEVNADISREKERTGKEQDKNTHDTQTKEERGL